MGDDSFNAEAAVAPGADLLAGLQYGVGTRRIRGRLFAMTNQETHPRFAPSDTFVRRHIGPRQEDVLSMLKAVEASSLEELVASTVPAGIRAAAPLRISLDASQSGGKSLPAHRLAGEQEVLELLREIATQNTSCRSLIGAGYYDCIVPPVILRNILENPGWYTQYTPYQAEISQGRLEALILFQTMVADLTGLPLANASLLDEGTAAAEAMAMCHAIARRKRPSFFASKRCHPQTLAVLETRAEAYGIELVVGDEFEADWEALNCSGVLLQYPDTEGCVHGYKEVIEKAKGQKTLVVMAADLLALTLLTPPGELGADICVGSAQRFGVPLGFGGPHAAFMSTQEAHKRQIPGRIIGVSKDRHGRPAYRMAMQTREQHIRRDKASSNICTAQVLLAIMAGMYGVYHGPKGLQEIAQRVSAFADVAGQSLAQAGHALSHQDFFDTVVFKPAQGNAAELLKQAEQAGFNLRAIDAERIGLSLDEKTTICELSSLLAVLCGAKWDESAFVQRLQNDAGALPKALHRSSRFMEHERFSLYQAEHEMLRYLSRLQAKDLSLTTSMIALGSCTMKLNATSEMLPVSWPEFSNVHPFAPASQTKGYQILLDSLSDWLCEITGFSAMSLQPNAGSQGEYTGLLTIRAYHRDRGDHERKVCLIPVSAHGTNPASAVMVGMKVVAVACDEAGNIDVEDLRAKAEKHKEELAALMVTYPSTHGVFETEIREICTIVHDAGGLVYLDGANMNAQVGLCRPGDYGADVCHLNLHKTFCIPHGGGGPGMGPIGVNDKLKPYLPGHPLVACGGEKAIGPVAAAPFGSASILPISWMYIAMMGSQGLREATELAILNANYMSSRLSEHYPVLFRGENGRVAHEFIVDIRGFKSSAGVEAEDIAKRLMDYGFHSPTMSFPVAGTLMIEPTESESKAELDRFCDAMIAIRQEIAQIEAGNWPQDNNPLCNAPHTAQEATAEAWEHPYTREQAVYPLPWVRAAKFWPTTSRIDNAWGDRNLMCSCPPMESYES